MARQLYTEKGDAKVDKRITKKLTPAQKKAFEAKNRVRVFKVSACNAIAGIGLAIDQGLPFGGCRNMPFGRT